MWMMPEITLRSSTRRAPGWLFGRWGSVARHASSESQNHERDVCNSLLPPWSPPESMYTPIFKRLIEFGPYEVLGDFLSSIGKSDQLGLVGEFDLGGVSLTSVTGRTWANFNQRGADNDGTQLDINSSTFPITSDSF